MQSSETNQAVIEPGIYPDMPNEVYHSSAGVSKSGLSLFARNPEKYQWRYILGNQQEQKPQYIIGSAFHTATLEPEKFDSEYVVAPKVDKRTKAGKDTWAKFQADNVGKELLSADDYDMIMAMAASVRKHPDAAAILSDGFAEASIFAECPYTGELVKVRPDWITEDIICDLKSTTDASPSKFFRDMYTYSYHLQAGMYPEVANWILDRHIRDFIFICVEKEPPYSVAVYLASEEDRNVGLQNFRRNLRIFSQHRKEDNWPSYNDGRITETALPIWAKREESEMELHDPSSSF